ncbi:MAG TPA: hypothetical protein VHZ81_08710 [Galbitalea sp.]|nr:hypothetical protein [Galbitalea sp.]
MLQGAAGQVRLVEHRGHTLVEIPKAHPPVFCHGDWTDGDLLAVDDRGTGVIGQYVPQLLFPTFAAIRRGAVPSPIEWVDVETVDGLDASEVPVWVFTQIDPAFAGVNSDSTAPGNRLALTPRSPLRD